MKTKKRILYSLIISIIIYIFTSFVKWDILWIREMPTYEQSTRLMIILIFFCFQSIIQLAITQEDL